MPTVPRVSPAPLPGARVRAGASDSAFGGGAGNAAAGLEPGLSAVHQTAYAIAREEKVKADHVQITRAVSDLSAARNHLLYGPNGSLTTQGSDAFTAPESTRAGYDAATQRIRASLTSDEQRAAFDDYAGSSWRAIDEQVQSHVARERQAYDTDTTDAFVSNLQNQAMQGYADPATVAQAIGAQRVGITAYGARNGWSPEQTQAAVAKQVSATHIGVLARMLDAEQDITAQQYFETHRDEITGGDQTKIERALKVGSTLGEANRAFQKITAPPADGAPALTAVDALAQAEAIENPKVRDETIKLVTAHFNQLDRAQRLDRENARARVLKSLEASGGRLNRASSDWQLIDGYTEGEHVLARQQQMLHPPPDRGDPDKLVSYLAMAATSPATRQALLNTNIADIVGDNTLNGAQKTQIINLIRAEHGRDLTDLRRETSTAATEAKRLEGLVNKARDDGDDETVSANVDRMHAAQQRASVLRGRLILAERAARTSGNAVPADGQPDASAADGSAAPAAAPTDSRTSGNPLGLTPLKPLTPDMQQDLLQYGAGYADYLRKLGYAVPKTP